MYRVRSALLVMSVLTAACGQMSAPPSVLSESSPLKAGAWTTTGSMATPRASFTAPQLPSGKVLATGGTLGPNAELYDPASGTWAATGSMLVARYDYQTTTLLPSGLVLVAGGEGPTGVLAEAELYDPVSGTWTVTGSLFAARYGHTATLLSSGRVLVVGGLGPTGSGTNGVLASAELYDPTSGTWAPAGSLTTGRAFHTATLLPSGKVLVAGGQAPTSPPGYAATAEIYDPGAGTWTQTGTLLTPREYHTATLLGSGKVLVAGGFGPNLPGQGVPLASVELYDSASGTWTATQPMSLARWGHSATLLSSGLVLVAGGFTNPQGAITNAESYDPKKGTWTAAAPMAFPRYFHAATLLSSGALLVAGGQYGGVTAEIYK